MRPSRSPAVTSGDHDVGGGAPHPEGSPLGPARRLSVLVVDDSPSVRELVADLVVSAGGTVVGHAADGEEAVTAAAELRPDVVVMDWRMPVMDGVTATAAIRRRLPGVEVIAFSSAGEADIAEAFRRAGAVAYIDKADPLSLARELKIRTTGR
jgi:two-component system, NarL family, response regulator LiaR